MKWPEEKIEQLRKLCFEEKTNTEIAKIMGYETKGIHAARSRLGITIAKVKAAKETITPNPWEPIKAAFDQLDKALLDAAEKDTVNAQTLRQVAGGVSIFKVLLLNAVE